MRYQARKGLISGVQEGILEEYYKFMDKQKIISMDALVYLRGSPRVCWERAGRRNWSADEGVQFEYLESIHKLYDEWIISGKGIECPIFILNGDEREDVVYEQFAKIVQSLMK